MPGYDTVPSGVYFCMACKPKGLLGYYVEGDFYFNFFVRLDDCGVGTEFFHCGVDADDLAVYDMTDFLQSVGNLDGGDAAEDGAGGGSLGADGEVSAFESLAEIFCFGTQLGNLVGALTLFFLKLFYGTFGSDDSFAGGDQEVTTVAILYLHYVVFVTQAGHIFFKYQFHVELC